MNREDYVQIKIQTPMPQSSQYSHRSANVETRGRVFSRQGRCSTPQAGATRTCLMRWQVAAMTGHGKSHAIGPEARASNISVRRVAKTTLSRQTCLCLVSSGSDDRKWTYSYSPIYYPYISYTTY